jgi:hypothetical protein
LPARLRLPSPACCGYIILAPIKDFDSNVGNLCKGVFNPLQIFRLFVVYDKENALGCAGSLAPDYLQGS